MSKSKMFKQKMTGGYNCRKTSSKKRKVKLIQLTWPPKKEVN